MTRANKALKWTGIAVGILLVAVIAQRLIDPPPDSDSDGPALSAFLDRLEDGDVEGVTIDTASEELEVTPAAGGDSTDEYAVAYPPEYSEPLITKLRARDVPFDVEHDSGSVGWLTYLLWLLLGVAFWVWLARRLGGLADRLDAIGQRGS